MDFEKMTKPGIHHVPGEIAKNDYDRGSPPQHDGALQRVCVSLAQVLSIQQMHNNGLKAALDRANGALPEKGETNPQAPLPPISGEINRIGDLLNKISHELSVTSDHLKRLHELV